MAVGDRRDTGVLDPLLWPGPVCQPLSDVCVSTHSDCRGLKEVPVAFLRGFVVDTDTSMLLLMSTDANVPSRPDRRAEQADPLFLEGGEDACLWPCCHGALGPVRYLLLLQYLLDVTGSWL